MTAEAEILTELTRLRLRVPQLTGAIVAGADGLVLASDGAAAPEPPEAACPPGSPLSPGSPGSSGSPGADGVAALTAAALSVASRLTEATGQGAFHELVVRGGRGYVASYAAGSSAVLTLLASPRVNIGRLHLEARRSGTRIGELVDGTTAPGLSFDTG